MNLIAILGCVTLISMIIRNSMILVDQIETDIAARRDRLFSASEVSRLFEPIDVP